MNAARGIFITFEGGEGSGKSTQAKRLAAQLQSQGFDVVLTREPGGTNEAEKIRALLVDRDGGNWSPLEECLLLFAARAHHVRTLIQPALDAGKAVVCDRFTDSTKAYQGYGLGLSLDKIEVIEREALGDFKPDLTFLLDIPAKDGLARSSKRLSDENSTEDRYENLALGFHEMLRKGFLEMATHEPERFRVIDASLTIDDITAQIQSIAAESLVSV